MDAHLDERRGAVRAPVKLSVDHILSEKEHCLCETEDLGLDGLRVSGPGGVGWGAPRHVWLEFALPDGDASPIRALGELRFEGATGDGRLLRGYRFKYMNPKARRRYPSFVLGAAAQA